MVPVYILRTSVMNSIYPLRKSILMVGRGKGVDSHRATNTL